MRTEGLWKSYDGRVVIRDLTLKVEQPTLLVGPSGEGKTTLLRLLLGLEAPDRGRVFLEGKPGVVFQEDRLIPHLNPEENIRLASGPSLSEETLREAFQTLGLTGEVLEQPCARLSGGEKRRVALLRALLCPADCLLLDEPFTGLDPQRGEQAADYTRQMVGDRPCLLVCHDPVLSARLGWPQITLGEK